MQKAFVPLWLIFPCVLACGDDGAPFDGGGSLPGDSGIPFTDAGDSAVDAAPLDAGSDAQDGAVPGDAAADAGEGGTSEPLTDRGYPVAEHCSPLEYSFGPGDCQNTQENYDAAVASGIDPDDSVGVGVTIDWQVLPAPMVPGTPYAISHEIKLFNEPNWDFEVWGVYSRCAIDGEQAVLLASTPLNRGSGVYCVTAMPTEAFTHILLVHRQHTDGNSGYSSFGQGFCPGGSCPAP